MDDYFEVVAAMRAKYRKCVVFAEVGSFFEVYDRLPPDRSIALAACQELHLTITQRAGVFLAGVPAASLAKHRAFLLERGFTVVVVGQEKKGDELTRRVTHVASPGFDEESTSPVTAVAVLRAREAAVCRFDVHANALTLFDVRAEREHLHLVDELRAALADCGSCAELVLLLVDPAYADLEVCARFPRVAVQVQRVDEARHLHDRAWLAFSLRRAYPRLATLGDGILAKLELDDAPTDQLLALSEMTRVVAAHDERLLRALPVPERGGCEHLRLAPGTLSLLDVFDAPRSLADVLGAHVGTPMGKRALRARLSAPTSVAGVIVERLDELARVAAIGFEVHDFRPIHDLTRVATRVRRGRLQQAELGRLATSHEFARRVLARANEPVAALEAMLALCARYVDDQGEFVHVARDDDALVAAHAEAARAHADSLVALERLQGEVDGLLRAKHATTLQLKPVAALHTTQLRAKALARLDAARWRFVTHRDRAHFDDAATLQLLARHEATGATLEAAAASLYESVLAQLRAVYFDEHAEAVARRVGQLDMLHGVSVYCAAHRYVRPSVSEGAVGRLEATRLRHPVVERLVEEEGHSYVPNDVRLGEDRSLLLYGANSVGKSCLLRSVATCVLLAQCGFHVPASACALCPYRALAVHVGGRDDVFRAQSTFVREMDELRVLLRATRRDGPRVLFLADELGNSTEDESAVKLVASVLHTLHARGVSVLLATHMFALQTNPYVQRLHALRNVHMRVRFVDEQILFDRDLRDGLPDSVHYGAAIAARLLEEDGELVRVLRASHAAPAATRPLKRARYNRHARVADECAVCGWSPSPTERPIEFHHIEAQASAGGDGVLPSGKHVHDPSNLVALCDACHDCVHRDELTIRGWRETADGRLLDFERRHAS